MTPAEVIHAVDAIDKMRGDNEAAHAAEDALYIAVLRTIAVGHGDPQALALNALEAHQINFSRWYA